MDARTWWIPPAIVVLLGLANHYADWYLLGGWGRDFLTLGCAMFALWAWRGLALAPMGRRSESQRPNWGFLVGALLSGAWMLAWLLLPAWGLLKVVGVALFAPVLAWRWQQAGRKAQAAGAWIGWVLALGGLLVWLLAGEWRLERLVHSVMPHRPGLMGAHYAWGWMMEALGALSPLGGGWSGVPPVLTLVDDAAWLLRVGAGLGWLPMGLLAGGLVLLWLLLAAWLSRSPVGARLSLRSRRLGVALALFHALAAALYGAWSFGYLYRPMGALAPLSHAGWWVLSLALALVVWRARQQRLIGAVKHSKSSLGGTHSGKNVWRLAALSLLALAGLALAHFPQHISDWRQSKGGGGGSGWPERRMELADHTGEHLLAQNVRAYDLWLRPNEFWAASWENPKSTHDHEGQLTDQAREAVVLDALAPWPGAASLARYRLANMPHSAYGPKLLLWAQPKEVADAMQARMKVAGVNGLEIKQRWARQYLQGALTAHAIGFASTSESGYGQEGLEMVLDRRLRYLQRGKTPHAPMRTSLDLDVQRLADGALRTAMEKHGASEGAVVVVDVATSEVRALVSAPNFDPNDESTYRNPYQPERIMNHAMARPVALGSLLTPLLVADLLQRGALRPDAMVDLGGAKGLNIGGTQVRDMNPAPSGSLAEIVARSSNVGQAKLALLMTERQLQSVLVGSGLHGPSGMVGLMGADFDKPDWNAWTTTMQATAGQNLSSTLARAVQAYVPIANGGVDRRLTLLAPDAQGQVDGAASFSHERRVLSDQTACEVRRMLNEATGLTGTAPLAQVVGTSVAGKSGTASHLPVMEEDGKMHFHPQSDALFIGMAPAEKPQYLIGVRLGFADGKPRFGGQVAAPVFAQVVRGLFPSGAAPEPAAAGPCAMAKSNPVHEETIR